MKERLVKCDVCGGKRWTIRKAPTCNHNQEETGTPIPVTPMVDTGETREEETIKIITPRTGKMS